MTWQIGLMILAGLPALAVFLMWLVGEADRPQHDGTELRRRAEEAGKRNTYTTKDSYVNRRVP